MKRFSLGLAALMMLGTQLTFAAQPASVPAALVEAVQMPAWVLRGGERIPLAPGMALQDRDQLRTGANSKLLLKMAEGSLVKLGENGVLRLERMSEGRDKVYTAAMKVLHGAFRFTTDALRPQRRRDIHITIATVTAGIRGTDVWGKAAPGRDIVCLIEGKIEVQRGEEQPLLMDQPLSFYIAPRGAPALPVAAVDPAQLRLWAAETEIESGKGAARRGGKWNVIAASVETQEEALKLYDALRAGGYAAQIRPAMSGERRIYLVRLAQLPSKAEAEVLAGAIRGKMGVAEPRVSM
jgi:hypothetical protein